ncbi:unnamed protein product, partial [Amoebophrya sp. A120]
DDVLHGSSGEWNREDNFSIRSEDEASFSSSAPSSSSTSMNQDYSVRTAVLATDPHLLTIPEVKR